MEEEKRELSREEILERSRRENRDGDERERQGTERVTGVAYIAALLLLFAVQIVCIFFGRVQYEAYIVLSGMQGAYLTARGICTSKFKKLFLGIGIFMDVCCIAFVVFWILFLCGVEL